MKYMTDLKSGWDGLLEAVFELAHEDEWKLQRARLKVATGDEDIAKKHEKIIRNEIGRMLMVELHEYPATRERSKQLREEVFKRIMEALE